MLIASNRTITLFTFWDFFRENEESGTLPTQEHLSGIGTGILFSGLCLYLVGTPHEPTDGEILRALACAQKIKFDCIPGEGIEFGLEFGPQVTEFFDTSNTELCRCINLSSGCLMNNSYSCTCYFNRASTGIVMKTIPNKNMEHLSESAILDPRFEYENPPTSWLGITTSVRNCNASFFG